MTCRRGFEAVLLAMVSPALACVPEGGAVSGAAGAGGNSAPEGTGGSSAPAGMGGSSTTGAAGNSAAAGSDGNPGVAGSGASTGGAGAAGSGGSGGSPGGAGAAGVGGSTAGAGGASGGRGGASGGRGGTSGGRGGAGGRGGGSGAGGRGGTTGAGGTGGATAGFSFFVTSLGALRTLSGNQNGFGGDLRFGETGAGAGLRGADKICTTIAEMSMPGSGAKGWRAFLSAASDGAGSGAINAIDRIGTGPWHDRLGRLVAMNRAGLMMTRPQGDAAITNDLPNENGIPNHSDGAPGCTSNSCPDNHDTLTGSNSMGMLLGASSTCADWTSAVGSTGRPGLGHSWPAQSGQSWMQVHAAGGCAPSVNVTQSGGVPTGATGVGDGGGYGGFYCFAVTP